MNIKDFNRVQNNQIKTTKVGVGQFFHRFYKDNQDELFHFCIGMKWFSVIKTSVFILALGFSTVVFCNTQNNNPSVKTPSYFYKFYCSCCSGYEFGKRLGLCFSVVKAGKYALDRIRFNGHIVVFEVIEFTMDSMLVDVPIMGGIFGFVDGIIFVPKELIKYCFKDYW